ncbi:MAG: YabP/YqfC family sporulation protein [Christensenellales bacterium]
MEEKKIVKSHGLKYENGKKISLTGIKNVEGFSDRQVVMTLDNGKVLTMDGTGLSVTNLDVDNGNLEIDGELFKIVYASERTPKSFLKKLFK